MKIIPIFGKNFKSIQSGKSADEFRKIFRQWNDPKYLEGFFERHKKDLTRWNIDVEGAVIKTLKEVENLEGKFRLLEAKYNCNDIVIELDELFEPLHRQTGTDVITHNKVKFNWLRIYALKLDADTYIVTGGAIKLTQRIQDRRHTILELQKLNSFRSRLIDEGIINEDTIIEEVEF